MNARTLVLVASVALVALACGAKAPTPGKNPLGGPINTGGQPDPSKSKTDAVDVGGPVNTGGAPDTKKSTGAPALGGPINSGGAPDLNKSVPKKDAGAH